MHGSLEMVMLFPGANILQCPFSDHLFAIDKHNRVFMLCDGRNTGTFHIHVEHFTRIGQIDLIDIVIDGPAFSVCQGGNGVPVVGETGFPACAVNPLEIVQQVNFVQPGRIAHLLDRPDKYALGSILDGFRT